MSEQSTDGTEHYVRERQITNIGERYKLAENAKTLVIESVRDGDARIEWFCSCGQTFNEKSEALDHLRSVSSETETMEDAL